MRRKVRIVLPMFEMPTQLVDWHCALQAVDPAHNVARAYRIETTRDLFGHIIVELGWGRIGRRGSGLTISFSDEEAARRFVQRTLTRRASAPRRIGVAYALLETPADACGKSRMAVEPSTTTPPTL